MTTQAGGKKILIHGMSFVLAGLLWGIAAPMTPYPRLALGAHIQFEVNGMLFAILGMVLLKLPLGLGPKSVRVMLASVWLTWLMVFSEVTNSWWGARQLLAIAARQAGAPGAAPWQETFVTLAHLPASLALILSFILLIISLARYRECAAMASS